MASAIDTAYDEERISLAITGDLLAKDLKPELIGIARGRLVGLLENDKAARKQFPQFPMLNLNYPEDREKSRRIEEIEARIASRTMICRSLDARLELFEQERAARERVEPVVQELSAQVAQLQQQVEALMARLGSV